MSSHTKHSLTDLPFNISTLNKWLLVETCPVVVSLAVDILEVDVEPTVELVEVVGNTDDVCVELGNVLVAVAVVTWDVNAAVVEDEEVGFDDEDNDNEEEVDEDDDNDEEEAILEEEGVSVGKCVVVEDGVEVNTELVVVVDNVVVEEIPCVVVSDVTCGVVVVVVVWVVDALNDIVGDDFVVSSVVAASNADVVDAVVTSLIVEILLVNTSVDVVENEGVVSAVVDFVVNVVVVVIVAVVLGCSVVFVTPVDDMVVVEVT